MPETCGPSSRPMAMLSVAVPAVAPARLVSASRHDGSGPDDCREAAGVDPMVRLLDQALALGRELEPAHKHEPFDMCARIGAVVGELGSERLTFIAPPVPVHALGDEAALRTMLTALAVNALAGAALVGDALGVNSGATRAIIRLDHGLSAIAVHVDDNGWGIPRSERAGAFDPAPLLTELHAQGKANNPALVAAQRTARQHGGIISISSSPEGGARFTVQLPLLAAHEIDLGLAAAS